MSANVLVSGNELGTVGTKYPDSDNPRADLDEFKCC